MDKFLLYEMEYQNNTTFKPNFLYHSDYNFLTNQFLIPFTKIVNNIKKEYATNKSDDFIDNTYDEIYHACLGYSLTHLVNQGYSQYFHNSISISSCLLSECEQQIKQAAILSVFYQLAFYKHRTYEKLLTVASEYSDKKYYYYDSGTNCFLDKNYNGYKNSDTQIANQIRYSFDKLYKDIYINGTPIFTNKKSYYADAFELRKEKGTTATGIYNKRLINSFLKEFTYDLIINNFQKGFNLNKCRFALLRNKDNHNTFRRETKKFIIGLGLVEKNFHPKDKSNTVVNNLYYFKKESLFHTSLLNYAINTTDDYAMRYLTDLIDMPVMPDLTRFFDLFGNLSTLHADIHFVLLYLSGITFPVFTSTFFMVLCNYFHYDFNQMYDAIFNNLKHNNTHIILPENPIPNELVKMEKATRIGNALIDNFIYQAKHPHFDTSFYKNTFDIDLDNPFLDYIQTEIALAYYETILA